MIALIYIIKCLLLIVYVLLMVAFYTILERKIIAYMQRRRGPNVVGPFGLLQAISDALKLLVKKTIYPQSANVLIFIVGPMITFVLSFLSWSVIPFEPEAVFSNTPLGLLYLLSFSSLSLYGLVMGGWSSNSKYAFFGAIRAVAQMISYEVSLGLILICIVCCAGTLNLSGIVLSQVNNWFILPHFPLFFLFFISALAETNRHPFDFAEAESELVSGYNTEYSALLFVLFFLAEYSNMILMSTLISILFLGGWLFPITGVTFFNSSLTLGLKTFVLMNFFVIVRASYPRLRYDQLMQYCWKIILPFTLAWFVFTVCFLKIINACPPVSGPLTSYYTFVLNYNYVPSTSVKLSDFGETSVGNALESFFWNVDWINSNYSNVNTLYPSFASQLMFLGLIKSNPTTRKSVTAETLNYIIPEENKLKKNNAILNFHSLKYNKSNYFKGLYKFLEKSFNGF